MLASLEDGDAEIRIAPACLSRGAHARPIAPYYNHSQIGHQVLPPCPGKQHETA
jgi:hypothetical protein